MKSRACRSAAATCGCHRSTMKTTRGPSSAEPGEGRGGRRERRGSKHPQARTPAETDPRGQRPLLPPGTERTLAFSLNKP